MSEIPAQTVGEVPKKPIGKIVIAILLIVIVVGVVGLFWWYTQPVRPPVEYKTYSKYDFSFQYPKGMTISEQGLLESTATDNSGRVLGQLRKDGSNIELIAADWLKSATAPDLEISLKDALDAMAKAEEIPSLEKGKLVETTKAGHRMIYQYYTTYAYFYGFPEYAQVAYGIYGVWYCDTKQRLYQLNVMSLEEAILPIFQRYLDSFICH